MFIDFIAVVAILLLEYRHPNFSFAAKNLLNFVPTYYSKRVTNSVIQRHLISNPLVIDLDPIRMTRPKQTEILPELTPKIIDLKFTRTEKDPYRIEHDRIFFS